ncbi:hypothetical protein ACIRVF_11980 [Kitasatospora sp. NPDC101157]|uniref:hypothetical protein n=1 Tax=Kitasatospora sp. NPDC101157 TaxID=3364098 RepID=UPI00381F30D9
MSLSEDQPPCVTRAEIEQHKQQADEAADALEAAFRTARLPVPAGLSPSYGVIDQGYGPRVYLGTVGVRQAEQLIQALNQYSRLQGYVMDDEALGLAAQVLWEFRVPAISSDGVTYVRKELE